MQAFCIKLQNSAAWNIIYRIRIWAGITGWSYKDGKSGWERVEVWMWIVSHRLPCSSAWSLPTHHVLEGNRNFRSWSLFQECGGALQFWGPAPFSIPWQQKTCDPLLHTLANMPFPSGQTIPSHTEIQIKLLVPSIPSLEVFCHSQETRTQTKDVSYRVAPGEGWLCGSPFTLREQGMTEHVLPMREWKSVWNQWVKHCPEKR